MSSIAADGQVSDPLLSSKDTCPLTYSPPSWDDLYRDRGIVPKRFQRRTADAVLAGKDTILCAPTGAGKGIIFDMLRIAQADKIWVVILPLKALEEEMTQRIGETSVYVNEDQHDAKLLAEIKSCKYSMVFLSVEMANSSRMKDIFMAKPFSTRLAGLIVDEAHTVTDWGGKDFRHEYRDLGKLKNILGVKALAMSATLTKDHLMDLRSVLEMPDPAIINMGTDRSNLELRVLPMRHAVSSWKDLLYAMPELIPIVLPHVETSFPALAGESFRERFPVTYIYQSSKSSNTQMKDAINLWFQRAGLEQAVATYSADDSSGHKRQLIEDVRAQGVLVVICTNALGMGSDVQEIRRVIQWGLDPTTTISSFWQRVGRAGRDFGTLGTGFLFAEKSLIPEEVRKVLGMRKKGASGAKEPPAKLPEVTKTKKARRKVDPRRSVNEQMSTLVLEVLRDRKCPRSIILSAPNQPDATEIDPPDQLYTARTVYDLQRKLACCDLHSGRSLENKFPDAPRATVPQEPNGSAPVAR